MPQSEQHGFWCQVLLVKVQLKMVGDEATEEA